MSGARTALVTGGTRGIGRAVVVAAAAAGWRVAFTGRDTAAGAQVVGEVAATGGSAVFVPADLRDPAAMQTAIEAAVALDSALDVLVNSAATFEPLGPLVRIDPGRWDDDLALLLGAPLHMIRAAAPYLRPGGAVVNVSSVHGRLVQAGWGPYDVAKAGLEQMTRLLAVELAPAGIRVNAVAPGIVATERHVEAMVEDRDWEQRLNALVPLGRPALPAEVADAVLYLAGNRSTYVTGQVLVVDGGLTVCLPIGLLAPPFRQRGGVA